jgi:hypothetical protein
MFDTNSFLRGPTEKEKEQLTQNSRKSKTGFKTQEKFENY